MLCVVEVVWLDPNSFPLTYEDKRVIDDARFSVLRSTIREWNLYIRNVRRKDDGTYRCTLNTDPVRSKMVILHVKGRQLLHYAVIFSYLMNVSGYICIACRVFPCLDVFVMFYMMLYCVLLCFCVLCTV